MILEVTADQIAQLNDTDLRALVGQLCEREVRIHQHSTSVVTWGGHQNAGDGGIDVRVSLPADTTLSGYVPKAATGFQVKAQDMSRSAILAEMAPKGVLLLSITELAALGGAYIIVSSKGSLSDTALKDRKAAMDEAAISLPLASFLTLDFYDRNRIATWVNQHAGLVPWVREKLGLPLSSWRPFADWSSSPGPVDMPYLLDDGVRLVGPSIKNSDGLSVVKALAALREILSKPKGVVRLVGLSGVGKTRLIQALFDERLGEGALPQSDALYTDISDEPDPVPQEMLSRLVSQRRQVIMVVDNCGIELHRKLAAKIANSECTLSLITVEYDINDDEPENTDIFKLEPASTDLIEKILESRYPAILAPSRHVIAKFSDGNSRVAFALANTAKNGESLANLRDGELFDRLFYQLKSPNTELFDAAKACALLYSFDGETLEDGLSELVPLATLVGLTVDEIYKYVAELHRRQLVQKRGKWRAILPHALAHRLAKRALEDIPFKRIEDVIIKGGSTRILRSFSRRMGYLHDDERAIRFASMWFAEGGLLTSLGKLPTLGAEILENIAAVSPHATLAFFEEVAAKHAWFFGLGNENKTVIIRILRSIAYDPSLFGRCVVLLKHFAMNEVPGERDSTIELLKSLFWLYLSGTHATAAQRVAIIKTLFQSKVMADEKLGITLLGAMLQTSHFTSGYSFEFGAWKRDYGFHPNHRDQIRDWYSQAIEVGRAAGVSGAAMTVRVRRLMAINIAQLLQNGMFDEVIALADAFRVDGGWPEGWIGIRAVMKRDKEKMSEARYNMLDELEQHLRPTDLAEMIRCYALSPDWGAIDIAGLEDDGEQNPVESRARVYELCSDLGQQLAGCRGLFDALLPEIMAADSQKTFAIGEGVAAACGSLTEFWGYLKDEFLSLPVENREAQILAGFLRGAMARAPHEAEVLLDNALCDPHLHPYLVYWQINARINSNAFKRFMKMLTFDSVPISSFVQLQGGRAHEGLDDEELRLLLKGISAKEGGANVATNILGMRIYGRRIDNLPISESIRATGREYMAQLRFEKGSSLLDHMMGKILEVSFSKPEHELPARAFCAKIMEGVRNYKVYTWDLGETIAALTKTFPLTVLDMFLGSSIGEDDVRRNFPCDVHDNHCAFSLDAVPHHIWIGWAALKPDSRYVRLAQVMQFSNASDEEPLINWSASAAKLIEVASEPSKVLDVFLDRFESQCRNGSLADTMASHMPLIESLSQHLKPEIAAWAKKNTLSYAALIKYQRIAEAAEDRTRDETFE